MISRQNEIYSILGISWGEQSSPASPAVRTRQEEIFDILSFPAVSRHSSPNDVGATLAVARPQGSPIGEPWTPQPAAPTAPLSGEPSGGDDYGALAGIMAPWHNRNQPAPQSSPGGAAVDSGGFSGTSGSFAKPESQNSQNGESGFGNGSGHGGGGFSGGGGGRDGRADQIQQDLDDAESRLKTLKIDYAYAETPEQIFNYGRQIEEEQARIKELKSKLEMLHPSKKVNIAQLIGGTIEQGAGQTVQSYTDSANALFGGFTQELWTLLGETANAVAGKQVMGETTNPITALAEWVRETNRREAEYYESNASGNKAAELVNKYGPMAFSVLPDAILAFLTKGMSLGAQDTTRSLQIASNIAQSGELTQKIKSIVNATVNMMKSPNWLNSFFRTAGPSYEAALADGASEELASLYALATGWNNATIEVGGVVDDLGGIQALPEQLQALAKQGDSGFFLPWVKSTGSEIFEEGLQGILERGLKTVYSDDVPIYSNENPNAIINPELMKEEAKDAFIINSIMGAGQISAEAVRRALQVPAKVDVSNQNLMENENRVIQPQEGTNFPADPGDLETLNPETKLALNQDWKNPDDSPYVDNNSLQNTNQHDTMLADYPLDRSNIISDGSHIQNGKLKPNCTYTTGEHDYIYVTNSEGLIEYARADELQLKEHDQRLPHSRNTPGKLAGDDAGHLFGDLFGGSPKLDNLVSQAREVNQIEFRAIEREWADALKMDKKVSAEIIISYEPGSTRPKEFIVNYSINGEIHSATLKNTNKGG